MKALQKLSDEVAIKYIGKGNSHGAKEGVDLGSLFLSDNVENGY